MTFLGTTALALSLLTGAASEAPAKPETKVEAAPKTPQGTILFGIGIRVDGARLRIQGDAEKKIPLRVELPLGRFVSFRIIVIKNS